MNPAPGVIHFNCLSCGILLTVPAEMAGVTGPCPQCRATITSPYPAAPQQANPFAPYPQALAQPQPQHQPAPQPPPQPTFPPASVPAPASSLPGINSPVMATGAWQHAASLVGRSTSPQGTPSPLGSMSGASWPPSSSAAAPLAGMGTSSHPVMEKVLGAQPLPSAIPPYQDRSSQSRRRPSSSSRERGQRGAMWLALLMALLTVAGTSWFFRDQLRTAWLSYTMKDDESGEDLAPSTPTIPAPPPSGEASKFDPSAPPAPAASGSSVPVTAPSTPAPPAATGQTLSAVEPSMTVLPALPATAGTPASTGALVEVPGSSSAGPPVNVVPIAPPVPAVLMGITTEAEPALEALQKFFQARTWQDRLPFVQTPEVMTPVMAQYYAENPDGPLYPSHIQLIRHDKAPETGPPHCVFQVAGGGLKQPLPIMVEITDDGWRVDWLTFTEFKDELLEKFLAAPQPNPARFHVLMRRAHYFDDDVPALDKKTCFQVMPPMPGFNGDVFAVKGSPLAKNLDRQLGWEVSQAAAVVQLQWRTENPQHWVELTDLIQLNWRNAAPSEDSAKDLPPSGTAKGASKTKSSAPAKAQAVE